MTGRPLRVLHAIHDFLPRHQAGSEIYAAALCQALSARHHVTVLCAEYAPSRPHGSVQWRMHEGLPIAEITNNWTSPAFEDTYRPRSLRAPIAHVLRATAPDVVHVHSLLNLSFDLPALARTSGAAVVATLHDFTAVCPSGGQRVHRAERHVCHEIDAARCARCFRESPWAAQMAAARLGAATDPGAAGRAARHALASFDLAVSPSAALARELARFGLPPERTVVADYGFPVVEPVRRPRPEGGLRIGCVGTIVWHKGVHVLLEAARRLRGAWTLTIAGDTRVFPDYAAELARLADGLPVTLRGRFDRHEQAELFADLDVLVVPSIWPENSPLVIHEAFMAGVPVVGARAGGIPELVTDGVNGLLVEPDRADALAAALQRLVDAPALAAELGRRCPPVRSIEQDAAEWESRYASLVARAEARA